jgi:hypothetical protein
MLLRTCVFVLLASVAGCLSDPPRSEATGRYPLYSVNGKRLPAPMYQEQGWTREARGGYIEFQPDGWFQVLFLLHDVKSAGETDIEDGVAGRWSQTGDRIELNFPDGLVLPAMIDHETVTLDRVPAGFFYVYRR